MLVTVPARGFLTQNLSWICNLLILDHFFVASKHPKHHEVLANSCTSVPSPNITKGAPPLTPFTWGSMWHLPFSRGVTIRAQPRAIEERLQEDHKKKWACPNKDLKKAVGLTSDFLKVVTHQLYRCWNVIEESSSLFSALTTFAQSSEHVYTVYRFCVFDRQEQVCKIKVKISTFKVAL